DAGGVGVDGDALDGLPPGAVVLLDGDGEGVRAAHPVRRVLLDRDAGIDPRLHVGDDVRAMAARRDVDVERGNGDRGRGVDRGGARRVGVVLHGVVTLLVGRAGLAGTAGARSDADRGGVDVDVLGGLPPGAVVLLDGDG